jgi:hypothetical protein
MSPDAEEKINSAVALLSIAEKELHLAIEQLKVYDRADKQMVDLVVQAAFDKVTIAKRSLDEVRVINATK